MLKNTRSYAPLVYFDLETTGLNHYHNRIIEVCGQRESSSDTDEPIGNTYHHLCHLDGTVLPSKITELTGITSQMLATAPSEASVLHGFREFCGRTKSPLYLIAHNVEGFDKWFLQSRCFNHGLRIPSNWKYLDTIHMAKLLYPGLPSYSLSYLCKKFSIVQTSAHRADDDVRCLRELFHHLLHEYHEQYPVNVPLFSYESLDAIWRKTNLKR